MVSPVRIRVPPLTNYLQNPEKRETPATLPGDKFALTRLILGEGPRGYRDSPQFDTLSTTPLRLVYHYSKHFGRSTNSVSHEPERADYHCGQCCHKYPTNEQ